MEKGLLSLNLSFIVFEVKIKFVDILGRIFISEAGFTNSNILGYTILCFSDLKELIELFS